MSGDPVPPPIDKEKAEAAWAALVSAARDWAENYMDQWEKFRFNTEFGVIYVTLSMMTDYPDSFDPVEEKKR